MSPSPSPSPDSQKSPSTSSTLYLVTFLATLFLLLFVSCAIVLRSYILRRRYQRRLDEAMAAGMLLAPRSQGSKRKRFGAKPRLYDTWLAPANTRPVTWSQLMPLSAQPVFVKRKYKEVKSVASPTISTNNRPADTEDSDAPNAATPTPITVRLRNLLFRQQVQSPPPPPPTRTETQTLYVNEAEAAPDAILVEALTPIIPNTTIPSPPLPAAQPQPRPTLTATYRVRIEMLQVSVLIAMPSQSRSAREKAIYDDDDDPEDVLDDEDEDELPELVFGVSRIDYRQNQARALQQHRTATDADAEGRCVTCGGTVGQHPEAEQGEDPHAHGEDPAASSSSPSAVDFGEALRRRQPQVQFLEPQERDRDSNTNHPETHTYTQTSNMNTTNTNTNGVPEEVL